MDDLSESAIIMQALVQLLRPLNWDLTLIPIVPSFMIDLLATPVVCMMGIQSDTWRERAADYDHEISQEAVIFYLEQNFYESCTPMEKLPY